LILLKMLALGTLFAWVLKRTQQIASPLWIAFWILAVLAGSFRFIERSSLFSDLFCVLLLSWLLEYRQVTRGLIARLTLLFLFWVQLHPGYPLGLALLATWTLWNLIFEPEFRRRSTLWLLLPPLALLCNPFGLDEALYPLRFALNEAQVFKHFNLEWFPTYHPAFRWTPEVMAFWALALATLFLIWRERAWLQLRAWLAVLLLLLGVSAVRFVGWTSFGLILVLAPWATLRSPLLPVRPLRWGLIVLMAVIAVKNLTFGYVGSSGPRHPELTLDKAFFPIENLEFQQAHALPGRLYNSQDFGSYLIWKNHTPLFDHGFVTDMDFYRQEVVGVLQSQQRFLELAKKYDWTMLLVDKHSGYRHFYEILAPLPEWKIVQEDEASYLIYYLPQPTNSL
jgi:hypothetical protein